MVSKVFILGRTGSGKSTASCLLAEAARQNGWSVEAFNDYPFLREMFMTNPGSRFRPTDHNGFEVLDLSVYDEAIGRLLQSVQNYHPTTDKMLLTIEFTSNNYARALKQFDNELIRDAHFLFMCADLKTCLDRISKRILHPVTRDDYYVIETVLLQHYTCPYMPLHIRGKKVTFMNNMESLDELRYAIHRNLLQLFEHSREPYLFAPEHRLFSFA